MPDIEGNVKLFSQYSQNVQNVFLRALIAQYQARNLAYLLRIVETNFTAQLLTEYGMAQVIDSLISDYDQIARTSIEGTGLEAVGITFNQIPREFVSVLKELDTQFWFEHVRDVGIAAKRGLILASMGNVTERDLVVRLLTATRELSEPQVNALVNTQLRTFSRSVFAEGAESLPKDTHYFYTGPQDDRNRPECAETLARQTEEGFTESEIAGLPVGFIEGGGFNCRHSWTVVI